MAGISNDKLRALDSAMRQIEKDFGKGSIMRLGEASAKMNVETIPTGALSLDIARQNDRRPAYDCRGPEDGRLCGVY